MNTTESKKMGLDGVYELFDHIFSQAKAKDEFEYCCALLRIRGMEGAGWDTLQESRMLLSQTLSCIASPIDPGFRVRLLLLAYCHAVEMNFIYDMIANMIQISRGERYCMNWFASEFHSSNEPATYPIQKIERIQEWSQQIDQKEIGSIFRDMYMKDVRNAFDHSDYILYKDTFRIKEGNRSKRKLFEGGSREYKLELLIPKLELGINIALMLIQLTIESIHSYKENKRVPSRMMEGDPFFDMELTVEPGYGLTGFHGVPKHNNVQNHNLS